MIYTCGYENCVPGHSYGPVLRSGYLIHYILNGSGIYKARGRLFRLKKGDAFLICPGELIYYEADRHSPWSYTWIGMQGIKVKGYLERTTLINDLVVHYGEDNQLRLCHEKMVEALYFSKIFHQKMGVSPSEYRKNAASTKTSDAEEKTIEKPYLLC